MGQVHVLTGPVRRRIWLPEEKAALVGAAIEVRLADGAQLRIPAGTAPDLAAAVIRAAAGR